MSNPIWSACAGVAAMITGAVIQSAMGSDPNLYIWGAVGVAFGAMAFIGPKIVGGLKKRRGATTQVDPTPVLSDDPWDFPIYEAAKYIFEHTQLGTLMRGWGQAVDPLLQVARRPAIRVWARETPESAYDPKPVSVHKLNHSWFSEGSDKLGLICSDHEDDLYHPRFNQADIEAYDWTPENPVLAIWRKDEQIEPLKESSSDEISPKSDTPDIVVVRNWKGKQAFDWVKKNTKFGQTASDQEIWSEFTQRAFEGKITVWARAGIGVAGFEAGPSYEWLPLTIFRTHRISGNPYHDVIEIRSSGDAHLMMQPYYFSMFCEDQVKAQDWDSAMSHRTSASNKQGGPE